MMQDYLLDILIIGAVIFCFLAMSRVARYYLVRNTLTSHKFALIMASGLGLAMFILFPLGLVLRVKDINPTIIVLGIALSISNLVIGYPVAYLLHKYIFGSLFEKLVGSPKNPKAQ